MLQQVFIDTHCAQLDGAERTQPFGPETVVWRVEGHMFAAYTTDGQGVSLRSNSRDGRSAARGGAGASARPTGAAISPFAGPGWILVAWETPPDILRDRIDESYRLVRRDWRLVSPNTR